MPAYLNLRTVYIIVPKVEREHPHSLAYSSLLPLSNTDPTELQVNLAQWPILTCMWAINYSCCTVGQLSATMNSHENPALDLCLLQC